MSERPERLDVVVPTYNEGRTLRRLVAALIGVGRVLAPGVSLRVLIVDDASPDGTGEQADRLAAVSPDHVAVLHRPRRRGLGRAYVDAFERLLADPLTGLVAQMDADLSHDPLELPRMLEMLRERRADVVLGSRYVPGGSIDPDWAAHRRWLSRMANRVVVPGWLGLPLSDPTGGYRLWRRGALETIDPGRRVRSRGYGFQVEMAYLAWAAGLRVVEHPIRFAERGEGRSKMGPLVKARAIAEIVAIRVRHGALRRTGPRAVPPPDGS